MKSDLNQMMD